MTNREEIDQLAGEYVLGTLNAEERLAVETRRLQDAALRSVSAAMSRSGGRAAPGAGGTGMAALSFHCKSTFRVGVMQPL